MRSTSPATTKQSVEILPLTPDEFRAIVARVRSNSNRIEKLERVRNRLNWVAIVFSLGGWWISGAKSYLCVAIAVVCLSFLVTRLAALFVRKDRNEAERLLRFVESTQDVKQLGTVVDLDDAVMSWFCTCTVNYEDAEPTKYYIAKAVDAAVVRLLAQIQSEDAEALNTRQRQHLLDAFSRRADTGFTVLHTLEQIGDTPDLRNLERLLQAPYLNDEFRIAAEFCAEVIRQRIAREEGRDILLRPERKPEAVDTLLRPSEERQDTTPEQLLREFVRAGG